MKKKTYGIAFTGITAALYIILTLLSASLGLDKGFIQLRLSEALCFLPAFNPYSIAGLTIGCLISNLLAGAVLPDIILGSIATFIGAAGTYFIGGKIKILSALPPILSNTVIIPLILKYFYKLDVAIPLMTLSVFTGEFITCGIIGTALMYKLPSPIIKMLKRK